MRTFATEPHNRRINNFAGYVDVFDLVSKFQELKGCAPRCSLGVVWVLYRGHARNNSCAWTADKAGRCGDHVLGG